MGLSGVETVRLAARYRITAINDVSLSNMLSVNRDVLEFIGFAIAVVHDLSENPGHSNDIYASLTY